jgi:hypothetical protein
VDVTTFLIGRANRREGGRETVEWLVKEQLGERVWADGVLTYGGRAGVRRGVKTAGANETEAGVFAQALARVCALDPSLMDILMPILSQDMMGSCFPAGDHKTPTILPRSLAIVNAVNAGTTNDMVQKTLDDIVSDIAEGCVNRLLDEVTTKSAGSSVYAETLVEILRGRSEQVRDADIQVSSAST